MVEKNQDVYNAALDRLIGFLPSQTQENHPVPRHVEVAFNSKLFEEEVLLGIYGEKEGKRHELYSSSTFPEMSNIAAPFTKSV